MEKIDNEGRNTIILAAADLTRKLVPTGVANDDAAVAIFVKLAAKMELTWKGIG